MRIPKQFSLKGKLWKVILAKDLEHEDGTKCSGLCDTDNRTIYLESKQSKSERFSTFLHELFHAMVHSAHIPVNTPFTEAIEEILAVAFEDLLTQDFEINLMETHEKTNV
jgi:hypothetical protein